MAADLPVRQAPQAYAPPPVIAYFNWTGCYVGLNGGYGWSKDNSIDAAYAGGTNFAGANWVSVSGGFGGAQAGCNALLPVVPKSWARI